MNSSIPNSVIGAVASVISAHYYSHSQLDTLFMESGAPGNVPEGNCEKKCSAWLLKCNKDRTIDAHAVLGAVIQDYMDMLPPPFSSHSDLVEEGRNRIKESLAKNQLSYQTNGYILLAGSNPTTKTLEYYFKAGDFSSIEKEFERSLAHIDRDPHASITAASSIIESLCKTYIETFNIEMPNKQSIVPLWKTVQQHLGFNIDHNLEGDQRKIFQGLSSIVDGVGAFRTHIGSAHGRGIQPPQIAVAEARLAVNSAHTLVLFIMESWKNKSAV